MPSFLLRSGTSRSTIAPSLPGVVPALGVQTNLRCHRDTASLCRHLLLHSTNECWSTHADCAQEERWKPHQRTSTRFVSATVLPPMSLRAINSGCGFLFAYALMQEKSGSAVQLKQGWQPRCGSTIRLKLLKVNPVSVRRVVIASSYWTGQSLFSRLSTIAAGTSFGIICHFCDNTYFEIDAWGELIPWLCHALSCYFGSQHPAQPENWTPSFSSSTMMNEFFAILTLAAISSFLIHFIGLVRNPG